MSVTNIIPPNCTFVLQLPERYTLPLDFHVVTNGIDGVVSSQVAQRAIFMERSTRDPTVAVESTGTVYMLSMNQGTQVRVSKVTQEGTLWKHRQYQC